jgi:hypothetical protein
VSADRHVDEARALLTDDGRRTWAEVEAEVAEALRAAGSRGVERDVAELACLRAKLERLERLGDELRDAAAAVVRLFGDGAKIEALDDACERYDAARRSAP